MKDMLTLQQNGAWLQRVYVSVFSKQKLPISIRESNTAMHLAFIVRSRNRALWGTLNRYDAGYVGKVTQRNGVSSRTLHIDQKSFAMFPREWAWA